MTAVPQYFSLSEDTANEESTNDLGMAPEDGDVFDALNDETFGDAATFDEDWEQQHEQLASIVSGPTVDQVEEEQAVSNVNNNIRQQVNPLESAFNLSSEHNDSGWNPFSMDGFSFNIKHTPKIVRDENSKPFALICHSRPDSGDTTLPINTVQIKQPAGFNGKPGKPMTLDEVEKLLLSENNSKNDKNSDNLSSDVKVAENPLTRFFPGVNLASVSNNQESKISGLPPNIRDSIIPTNEPSNAVRPLFYSPNHTVLPGFRPFNQHQPMTSATPNAVGVPPRMLPPFLSLLSGSIPNPAFIQMEQLQQFQRRFPHQRRQFYHRQGAGRYPQQEKNDDEYAGLMTQSNKEWLIKIQNNVMNFGNPFKEDFYYVSYKSRQLTAAAKAKAGEEGSQLPSVIIPDNRKSEESTKVEYIPVQFEGSLGKIQVANVKCPRKLLDVDARQPTKMFDPSQDRPATPVGRAELNAFRRLLLDIEHLYCVMLDIDEEDKKMGALPEDQRAPHAGRRRELCLELFRGLYDERTQSINKRIASVRKGVSLIVRSLQVLSDANQKAAIVKSLLDPSNSHHIINYREKGVHRLDCKQIVTEILTQLRESKLPEIDNLTNSLNSLSISRNQQQPS